MRQPTPLSKLYAWWIDAMSGGNPERHEDEPQCGFYKRRIVKGGPWVPCRIMVSREFDDAGYLASEEKLILVTHDGQEVDPGKYWTYLTPISRGEYFRRMAEVDSLATHAPVDLIEEIARP